MRDYLIRSLVLMVTTLMLGLACTHAWAQQSDQPAVIGLVSFWAPLDDPAYQAFREALRERGYVEGRNIKIDFRNADGRSDRLPAIADELVRLGVDVIVVGNTVAARAVKRPTSSIPIVIGSSDPVVAGLASSYAHPGGNLTGVSNMTTELTSKRLQLLKETIPGLKRIAVLWRDFSPQVKQMVDDIKAVAPSLAIEVSVVRVQNPEDVTAALARVSRANAQALYVVESPLFYGYRKTLTAFALKARLPALYGTKPFAVDGGLLSYGADIVDQARRVAGYVDKILKGAKPADLPIERATKLQLVINLKTAKGLGLTIPTSILSRADEVIR